ncbi:MAG TPA: 4-(cytidine 5'-diphospho)-2-C-methyl-D-erythritol kinase, partial [Stellaceae bacterium]|nr:4-(cytidine 5'-diphospho)-2-C-methyl-D-erythritol kinase [Stellaceae bacterium]
MSGRPPAADRVAAFAPAKVNLYLHVLGRRPDGYHLLDSLVAFADIGDRVEARPAAELSLAVEGPEAAGLADAGDNNLVLLAARRLAAHAGIAPRAALRLEKRLPVASGLGGGSSDAAAALRALGELWRVRIGAAELAALG